MAIDDSATTTFQSLIDAGALEIGDGYRAKNNELGGTGPIFLRAGHVTDSHIDFDGVEHFHAELKDKVRHKMAHPGDTVVTTKGNSTGRTSFVSDRMPPFVYSPHLSYWRSADHSRIASGFLRYWSRGREFATQLAGMKASTDMAPYLSLTDQRRLEITLPSLTDQEAIAEILGALDDKIELNRRMNETLEAMARAIFKSWFVDFDPVRAKLDGRTPSGMDAETAALFPDQFDHTELGLVPKGWSLAQLADEIGFQGGYAFKSRDWQDAGVPVVKIGSVKPGIIDLNQVSFVSDEIANEQSRFRLSVGDLLIGMTGYVGEVGIVPPTSVLPLLNQRVGKFVLPKSGTESLAFWYCTTRQSEFRTFVERRSHGTAQANVSATAIMEFPLVTPPPELLTKFNSLCRPMLDQILRNHAANRTLSATRDALLPKLLSGELRVANAEHELDMPNDN